MIQVKGRCYHLGQPAEAVTYNEAKTQCSNLDGYLASLNTMAEMEAVTEALLLQGLLIDVHVGLTLASESLDSM